MRQKRRTPRPARAERRSKGTGNDLERAHDEQARTSPQVPRPIGDLLAEWLGETQR
jgi:hypothetical protein